MNWSIKSKLILDPPEIFDFLIVSHVTSTNKSVYPFRGILAEQPAEDMEKQMQELNKSIVTQKEEKIAGQAQPEITTEKYKRPEPKVKINLRYPPMKHVTHVGNYFVEIPKCYHDGYNFNWDECDYQLQFRDQQFLKELNSMIRDTPEGKMITIDMPGAPKDIPQEPLTEDEFEKVIDILEKVYQTYRSKNADTLSRYFYEYISYADEGLRTKINPIFLKNKLIRYYNLGKRCYFIRKFWENPDANDPDSKAAFKKRNENTKMELRKSQNVIKKKQ